MGSVDIEDTANFGSGKCALQLAELLGGWNKRGEIAENLVKNRKH